MNKFFYLRLAAGNLKRNKEVYTPYLLASSIIVMIYYTFLIIAYNPGMSNIPESTVLSLIMKIGVWIGAIFAVIFIFYANSFLIKKRKKEFGLYGILGLEKHHVARMMFYETGIAALSAIVIGIVVGTAFGKLAFLILMKLMHIIQGSSLIVTGRSIVLTIVVFLIIFAVALVFNLLQVHMARPIELMRSKNKGEREPKGSWPLAVIGAILLMIGYVMAQKADVHHLNLLILFFPIVAVIAGTYCLFIAGSIKILRILKHNKKIYYKPDNFISISGLIYRMKQNAVGLASICIICTMVIITLSITINFQLGGMRSMSRMVGSDLYVGNIPTEEYKKILLDGLNELAPKYDINIERCDVYPDKNFGGYVSEGKIISPYGQDGEEEDIVEVPGKYTAMTLMNADVYERLTGEKAVLKDGHVWVLCSDNVDKDIRDAVVNYPTLQFFGNTADPGDGLEVRLVDETMTIDKVLTSSPLINDKYVHSPKIYVIFPSDFDLDRVDNYYVGREYTEAKIDFDGLQENRMAMLKEIKGRLDATGYASSFQSLDELKQAFYVAYGSLVFVGVLLSVLFLLAMVIIIYYKQMAEGYEDRERYQIMIKVGIDEADVKRTINKQVKTLFFIPLVTAIIHTFAAFKISCSFISMAMLPDYRLFFICTMAVILVVSIIYTLVYMITAKIYYKIVR